MKTNAQLSKKKKERKKKEEEEMGWEGLPTDKHSDKQREGAPTALVRVGKDHMNFSSVSQSGCLKTHVCRVLTPSGFYTCSHDTNNKPQ